MTIRMTKAEVRPIGITALSLFFLFGAGASFVSFISLLFPGSFLDPVWRLNPRARAGLGGMRVGGYSDGRRLRSLCIGGSGFVARRTMGLLAARVSRGGQFARRCP